MNTSKRKYSRIKIYLGQGTTTFQSSQPINTDRLICHTPNSPQTIHIFQTRNSHSSKMSVYATNSLKMTHGMNKSPFTITNKFQPTLTIAIRGTGSPNLIMMNTNKRTSTSRNIMKIMTLKSVISSIHNHSTSIIRNVHTGSNSKNNSSFLPKSKISTSMVHRQVYTSLQFPNLVISLSKLRKNHRLIPSRKTLLIRTLVATIGNLKTQNTNRKRTPSSSLTRQASLHSRTPTAINRICKKLRKLNNIKVTRLKVHS